MTMTSAMRAFSRVGVSGSRKAQRPFVLLFFTLQAKQLTQPLKAESYRCTSSVSAPASPAPSIALSSILWVFQFLRGLPLTNNAFMSLPPSISRPSRAGYCRIPPPAFPCEIHRRPDVERPVHRKRRCLPRTSTSLPIYGRNASALRDRLAPGAFALPFDVLLTFS